MAKEDAKITVGADASPVERAMAVSKAAVRDFSSSFTSSIGEATGAVVRDLAQVALSVGKISFTSQHAQVREFESATAHLAVAMGANLESVRTQIESTGVAIGKRPTEVAQWASEVGKLTFNFGGAAQAIKGLSGLASETGRSVDEYRGLAVELGTVGKVAGDTTHAVGVLQAQSELFKTNGGVAAFSGQVEALQDTISRFAVKSESDFLRVTAAAGALGKGLNDFAAKRVEQAALGYVAQNTIGIERYLGHRITDKHGQVADPMAALEELRDKVKKQYGGNAGLMLSSMLGSTEAGAALLNADFKEANKAGGLAPSSAPQAAQKAINDTDAGRRDIAVAQLAESSRQLLGSSSKLGSAADALQQFASKNPISSTILSSAAGNVIGGFTSQIAKAGGALTMLAGGATASAAGLGVLGVALAAGVYGIKKWEEATEERQKLEEHARDVAATGELKNKVTAIHSVTGALHRTGLKGNEYHNVEEAANKLLTGKDALAALQFSHGGGDAQKQLAAELRKEGESDKDADRLARALVDAMRGVKIDVTNAPDNPVSMTAKVSHTNAAGNMSM